MIIPTKKLAMDFEFPVYTLGTWLMGGAKEHDPKNDDEKDIKTIHMHIKNGVNSIFTAQNYADGYCEKLVGRAIQKFPRKDILLSTAIQRRNARYDDVLRSFDDSLARLGVDYVDILFHHARDIGTPIKETMEAMSSLVDKGMVRNLAVSNYSLESLKEAQDTCRYPIVANQVYYNLQVRETESSGLLEYCQGNDVVVQAYRPLSKGIFCQSGEYSILDKMVEKYQKTPSQIALNWLLSQKNVIVTCTTSQEKHLLENLGAIGWEMAEEDIEKLREEFPDQVEVGECGKLE